MHTKYLDEIVKERNPLKALFRWENNIKAFLKRNRGC
jgi:hypothetical protein